ncbi:MAG: glycosyltransferase [Muribaculaceae bacterium]|nr:glycosyltransferase [Muribaculaceae bacterium]
MAQRILLVNKFYYPRGGDCVVTFNTEALLRSKGHEVAVFSMQYPENIESEWSKYFASEVSFDGGFKAKLAALRRTLGWGDIKKAFTRILDEFKPDVVHLHNIHSYLSPVVAQLAKQRGCRVAWTLHDYKLLCPSYACLRNGEPCELCYNSKLNVLTKRCMKGALPASAIAWMEALKWNRKQLERQVDAFICPSQFMAQKMEQGGFDPAKLHVLCNFVDPVKMQSFESLTVGEREPYYCYVGRLSQEKGITTLLEVAQSLPFALKVAGGGPLEDELRSKYSGVNHIEFLGQLNATQVSHLLSHATCSVIPSEWYENNPLSVIESLCAGTPVVGAEIGGIPELIDNGNGVTFAWGDAEELKQAIDEAFHRNWNNADIQQQALKDFSNDYHYSKLISSIYK